MAIHRDVLKADIHGQEGSWNQESKAALAWQHGPIFLLLNEEAHEHSSLLARKCWPSSLEEQGSKGIKWLKTLTSLCCLMLPTWQALQSPRRQRMVHLRGLIYLWAHPWGTILICLIRRTQYKGREAPFPVWGPAPYKERKAGPELIFLLPSSMHWDVRHVPAFV